MWSNSELSISSNIPGVWGGGGGGGEVRVGWGGGDRKCYCTKCYTKASKVEGCKIQKVREIRERGVETRFMLIL